MSGKPHSEGVQQVMNLLDEVAKLDAEIADLRPKITRLKEAERDRALAENRLQSLLSDMDLESPGNFGYSGRLSWFLQEMRRSALAVKPSDK